MTFKAALHKADMVVDLRWNPPLRQASLDGVEWE